MAGEFEVTRLYAKIVPKLAGNFKSDLQRKINVAVKGAGGGATVKIDVAVNNASIDAAKKKIEQRLTTVKAKIKVQVDVKTIDQAMRQKKTITVNANTGPAERAIRQSFQKIEGSSLLFAKGISDNIGKNLKDGFVIPAGASSSIERHLNEVSREADKAAAKMKRDFDKAFASMQAASQKAVKVNVNDTELEKLKYANVVAQAAARGIEIKVDVDDLTAEKKLVALTRDRKVELKVDVDKSLSSQAGALLGGFGGGIGDSAKTVTNLGSALGHLGEGFGRVSSLAGAAGAILQGFGSTAGALVKLMSDASTQAGGFAAALGKLGSTVAVSGALAIFAAVILSVMIGLIAATAAAAGFVVVAVLLGAIMSAVAVAAGALSAAVAAATSALGALVAVIGVAAAALLPVFSAFSEFMNVQGEAPKKTNAATKALQAQNGAVNSSAAAIRAAGRAVRDANKGIEDAAYGVVRAQRQVRTAGENLEEAYRSQLRARERLTQAEEKAKQNLLELGRAARDAAGLEEDAEIRLIRAQERLAELDPLDNDSTDYREALRDVEQAERDLGDQREDNKKTQKDYDEAKKKGIKGDQDVIDARQGLIDAERGVRDAQEAQRDAIKGLNDAKYQQVIAEDRLKEALTAQREAAVKNGQAMQNLGTVTDTSTAAQRKLGKQFGELTREGQKFFEKIKDVYTWLKKLSAISQNAFLPGLGAALTQMNDLFPLIEHHFGQIGITMGEVAKKFSTMFTSDAGQGALDNIFTSINSTIGSLGDSLAKSLGTILPAMGRLAIAAQPLIDTLGSGFETIATGLGALFDSLAKPEVMNGMMSVVNTLTTVIGSTLTLFGGFMEKIGGTLTKLGPVMTDGTEKFIGGLFDAMATLINSGLVDSFFRFLGQLGDMLGEMAKNGFFQELGKTLGEALTIIGGALVDMFSDPQVVADFIELFQLMPPLIKQFMILLPGLLSGFLQFISASVKMTQYLSPSIIGSIVAAMFVFARVLDAVVVAGQGVTWFFENLIWSIGDLWNRLMDFTGDMISFGANLVAGLVNGLNNAWIAVVTFFTVAWNSIINWIRNFLGIHSPSTLFAEIGRFILEGLLNGLRAVWKTVVAFFNGGVTFIKKVFGPVWGFLKTTVTTAWNGIKSIITTSWSFIKNNIFVPIGNFLKNTLGAAFKTFKTVASTAFTNLKNALSGTWTSIKNNIFTPIKTFIKNTIPDAFDKGVENIKKFFNKLKEYTRTPVAFVVNTIYNDGIRSLWNKIASKIGMGELPRVEGFAQGGKLPGNSGMRYKDDRFAKVGRKGMVKLAGGEYIVNAPATKKYLPLLESLNQEGRSNNKKKFSSSPDIPGFGIGGFLGDLYKRGKGAVSRGIDALGNATRGALSKLIGPAIGAVRKLLPGVDKGRGNFNDLAFQVPHTALDKVASFIKDDDKKNADSLTPGGGGPGGAGMGYQAQIAILKNAGFNLGFSNGQLTGGKHAPGSNHYRGRAIDIGVGTNGQGTVEKVWQFLVNNYATKSKELYWAQKSVNYRNGQPIGPTDLSNHIHWAMKTGGLVTGKGGPLSDKVRALLSHGEYVMNSKATAALGVANLNRANDMANHGSSRRQIRANTKMVGAEFDGVSGGMTDNSRNIEVSVVVSEDHQAELLANRLNGML